MENTVKNEIIKIAEDLFFNKGYKSCSLQDIAGALKIKPASLYYHFPGGKEEIYIEVLKIRLDHYKNKISDIYKDCSNIEDFIKNFANWYLEQPTMNMDLIAKVDMPHLTPKSKANLMRLVSESLFQPLNLIFLEQQDELKNIDKMRLVGIYINMLNGMSFALKQGFSKKEALIQDFMEILLHGISK